MHTGVQNVNNSKTNLNSTSIRYLLDVYRTSTRPRAHDGPKFVRLQKQLSMHFLRRRVPSVDRI